MLIVLSKKIMLVIVTDASHYFFRELNSEQNHLLFIRGEITKTLESSKLSFESS